MTEKPHQKAHDHDDHESGHDAFGWIVISRITVAVCGAFVTWLNPPWPVWLIDGLAWMALAYAAWPIFSEAIHHLRQKRMTMELSMSIAVVAAASISELFTALVVSVFVLIAEEIEYLTLARGRTAIKDLVEFIPPTAKVLRNGAWQELSVDDIVIGDVVMVSPGEKVPVDGIVTEGHSYLDQSRITGESMPVEALPDQLVFAGSINQMGALQVRVKQVGRDTSFGRIIEAVENAEQNRAPVQKLADVLAGYLVYFSFAAALVTYLLTRDVRATISVIIVAGACGVAAGTPLAILGGIGRAAQLGAIIKGGIFLELLGRVDTIVFDKTGTLTQGHPSVMAVVTQQGVSADDVIRMAAIVEAHSEHPLARAIVNEAKRRGLVIDEPSSFDYQVGRGVKAQLQGKTLRVGNRQLLGEAGISVPDRHSDVIGSDIVVAVDDQFYGEIIVADPLRPEAADAVGALNRLGIKTVLMTGDTETVAQDVAARLGITELIARMLPENKLTKVRELVASKRLVAMVGDGVNDAPALTAAHVGIAMGSGTDIAKESADLVLIGNDLGKLVETMMIAQKTRAIIWQNFAGTIGVDTIGIVLASMGYLNPLLAALIHVGSELVFLSNSARLLDYHFKQRPSS